MPGKLYEFAVLHHPKPAKKDDPEPKSRVIVAVTNVLARDDKEAALYAAREIPSEFEDKLEEVEIVVRPFAG